MITDIITRRILKDKVHWLEVLDKKDTERNTVKQNCTLFDAWDVHIIIINIRLDPTSN